MVLPQDDYCFCKKRIGDHTDYEMWKCLQDMTSCIYQIKDALGGNK